MSQFSRLKYVFQFHANEWIPLPEILSMGIAQYNTRILELRREGMRIISKTERVPGAAQVHSWFRYDKDNLLNDDGTEKKFVYEGDQATFAPKL